MSNAKFRYPSAPTPMQTQSTRLIQELLERLKRWAAEAAGGGAASHHGEGIQLGVLAHVSQTALKHYLAVCVCEPTVTCKKYLKAWIKANNCPAGVARRDGLRLCCSKASSTPESIDFRTPRSQTLAVHEPQTKRKHIFANIGSQALGLGGIRPRLHGETRRASPIP